MEKLELPQVVSPFWQGIINILGFGLLLFMILGAAHKLPDVMVKDPHTLQVGDTLLKLPDSLFVQQEEYSTTVDVYEQYSNHICPDPVMYLRGMDMEGNWVCDTPITRNFATYRSKPTYEKRVLKLDTKPIDGK